MPQSICLICPKGISDSRGRRNGGRGRSGCCHSGVPSRDLMTADADQGTDARAEGGNEVVCKKCGGEMVFQPELFDPDRGHYVCSRGHRSGRVFVNEKQPAGVAVQQTAEKKQTSDGDSISQTESEKWYRVKCKEEAIKKAEKHPDCKKAIGVEENRHNWSWDLIIE